MWGPCWEREAPAVGPFPRHPSRGPATGPVTGSTSRSDQFPVPAILRGAQWMVFDVCWYCPHQMITIKEKVSSNHSWFHFRPEPNSSQARCPLPALGCPFPNLCYPPFLLSVPLLTAVSRAGVHSYTRVRGGPIGAPDSTSSVFCSHS